ncbi:MAG: nitroreductase, partial [Clostridia bacterium]|nr:nitroreductase [Clostridia bacterium]
MEDIWDIMRQRHSVRQYDNRAVEPEKAALINAEIERINAESGLRFTLFVDEPEAFKADKPSYGSFSGCRNYVVLAGKKGDDEKIGYFGERLVLFAQSIGLNTCWVAMTFEKSKVQPSLGAGEVLFDVLALGYGLNDGRP